MDPQTSSSAVTGRLRTRPRAADSRYLRPLGRFVDAVETLRRNDIPPMQLASSVARSLADLIHEPNWLCEEHCQPGGQHYRQHLLHVAPDGGFSVVALVWTPGQRTPIHDHVAWCVVGVYEGEETETRYQLYGDAGHPFLVETGVHTGRPGDTTALVPPDENIHEVRNDSSRAAISIHVYGANIAALGSSIHRRFDHVERRASPGSDRPGRWRAA